MEVIAVKTIALINASEQQLDFARKELTLMCTVSHELSGYVIELKGFHLDPGRELVIAMELADASLRDMLRGMPEFRLPTDHWVGPHLRPLECSPSACLSQYSLQWAHHHLARKVHVDV